MIRENFRLYTRENEDHSRSASREREKRDSLSRQPVKSSNLNSFKLHIAHLPLTISEEYVRTHFERFGRVEDVRIMRKDSNGHPLKGSLYGFVTMSNSEEAGFALDKLNQETALGWNVSYSRERLHTDSPRSPQKQRLRPRCNPDSSDEKLLFRHKSLLARICDSYDQNTEKSTTDNIEEISLNPDDFISYNNGGNESPARSATMINDLPQEIFEPENPQTTTEIIKALDLPKERVEQTTSTVEKSNLNGSSILVRELWFGNLSQNTDEWKLRAVVENFGEIENIEYYIKPNTSFAFVKFKTLNEASKANEAVQSLRGLLHSPNLKIAFSDHQRRKNVVGDAVDYERDEELTSIIYLGFPTGANIAPEMIVREIFSKYGVVLNVSVHQMLKQNSAKSYALVEMASLEQAKFARQKIHFEDRSRENRTKLGDRNCELCILSKPRTKDSSSSSHMNHRQNQNMDRQQRQFHPDMHPHHHRQGGPMNHHYNHPHHQRFGHMNGHPNNFNEFNMHNRDMPHGFINHPNQARGHFQHGQFPAMGPGPEGIDGGNNFIHPSVMSNGMNMQNGRHPAEYMANFHYQNPQFNPNFANPGSFGGNFGFNGPYGFNPQPGFNPAFNHNPYNHGEFDRRANNMEYCDSFQSQYTSTTASSNAKSPKDRGFSETMWTGYLTRNKQNLVKIDATLIQGDESILKDCSNLNISHRTTFEEIARQKSKLIVTFTPSDETQTKTFSEYIKYFLERDRAGFVSLKNYILYLLPPCEKAFEIHGFKEHELLGVIVDTQEASENTDTKIQDEEKGTAPSKDEVADADQDDSFDVNEVMSILNNTDLERFFQ